MGGVGWGGVVHRRPHRHGSATMKNSQQPEPCAEANELIQQSSSYSIFDMLAFTTTPPTHTHTHLEAIRPLLNVTQTV